MTGAGYGKDQFKNKGADKPNDSNKKYNAAIGKLAGINYAAAPKKAGMSFNLSGFNKPKKAGPSANEQYNAAIANLAKPKAKSKDEIKAAVKSTAPKAASSSIPKAGKYVMPYGKREEKRLNNAARYQDPNGLKHKNPRNPGTTQNRRSYTAVAGDSLYGIAEKTVPPGQSVGSWFTAIKKLNAGKKLYRGTGVSLPGKAKEFKNGR